MHPRKVKTIFLGFIAALVLIVVGGALAHRSSTHYGWVTLLFNSAGVSTISATLNGQPINISSTKFNQSLPDGQYNLVVKELGYKNFSTNFNIQTNKTIMINVSLQPVKAPTLTSLAVAQPASSTAGWSAKTVTYFYQNSWAFVDARFSGNLGSFFILNYSYAKQAWVVVIGPETILTPNDLGTLPKNLVTYLQDNGYIENQL